MNNPPIPDSFRKLPLPMPPTLPEVMGITSDKRFFRLNYEGSKAFWSDGRAGATFSYYAAYNPYVNHVAMSIHLLGCSLGHDDESPTHSLLIDRQETTVYVGAYNEVRRFLQAQHPPWRPPTPEEIEEMNRYLAEMERLSFDALRGRGMFEFLLGPKPEQQDRCAEMVAWLDQFITDDLIQAYVGAAESGQVEAFHYLDIFRRRVERAREVNTSTDWTN